MPRNWLISVFLFHRVSRIKPAHSRSNDVDDPRRAETGCLAHNFIAAPLPPASYETTAAVS
jgi:hypothetical protein